MSDTIDVSISMSTHIGDDATETDDLSLTEYGIHCRLRRALWRRGGVLDGDRSRLRRLVGAETDADVAALDAVIARLWHSTEEGGIAHPTTLAEIERARAKKASYQARGRKGGRPPAPAPAPAKAKPRLGKSSALAAGKAGGKTPPPPPPPPPSGSSSEIPDHSNIVDPLTEGALSRGEPAGPGGVGEVPPLRLVPTEAEPEATKARRPNTVTNIWAVYKHYYHAQHRPIRRCLKPSTKTWRAVAARLRDGWTVEELCKAIDGYHLSPFHQGQNETGTKYLDLELFMRSEEKVQKGIDFAEHPPKPNRGRPTHDIRIGRVGAEECEHPAETGRVPLP